MNITIDYEPLEAGSKFHESAASKKLAKGGKGSGKTMTMLRESQMLSFEYPNNVGFLGRQTFGELQEVIIDPLLDLTPDELILSYHKQEKKLVFINGSIIYFRSLDDSRKSKGLNLGWFGIDELDTAEEEDWLQLIGQVRRPGVRHVGMATTNPTPTDHWIYRRWVLDQLPDHEVFTFPTKGNKYLPKDFYEHLYATMPESWVRRYLEGEWGAITSGERVYAEFSERLHVDDRVVFNRANPVIRVWDFGLAGHACLVFQLRPPMGADFIGEVFKRRMTSRQFAQVVGRYCGEMFPEALFEDFGDIAGNHHDPTSLRSPIEEINEELGITIRSEQIPLKTSLDLVNIKMSQIVGGITALRFHPRCKLTIEGLNGGYVFKKNRDGSIVRGVPAEDGTFEHLMDCLRMGIWIKFQYNRPEKQRIILPNQEPVWEDSAW